MPLASFQVSYRFAGAAKTAPLAEWLADSMSDRFGGDLGLTQTTRVSVHQTKVRLLAAALDAVDFDPVPEGPDAALVEQGLLYCIERHRAVWQRLVSRPVPTFEYAFALHAPSAREPAFLQCPEPEAGLKPKEVDGLRLLPDFGFSVPAQVSVAGEADLAYQLMGFAGSLYYVKKKPTTSRPLGQAIAVDVPGRPAWRVRHEVSILRNEIESGRQDLGLCGDLVFAWLLPFLPDGRPIPRHEQHPLLLDVPLPVRVDEGRPIRVYICHCDVGGSEMYLPTAALGHRQSWAASGLPGVVFAKCKTRHKAPHPIDLKAIGIEPVPVLVQQPYGKIPSSQELLELLRSTPMGGKNGAKERLYPRVLSSYLDGGEPIGDQAGAELVIEGEPIGVSTTPFWLNIRLPLPEPNAGAETGEARWQQWQNTVERQIKARSEVVGRLAKAAAAAWLGHRQTDERQSSSSMRTKAAKFANRWETQMEVETDTLLWTIAARTWMDPVKNRSQWGLVLDETVKRIARQAFEVLGGFEHPTGLIASTKLLALIEGIEVRIP